MNEREQQIKMVVNFFNALAGTRCDPNREQNIKWATQLLDVETDTNLIRKEMKTWLAADSTNREKGFVGFAKYFIYEREVQPKEEAVVEQPKPQTQEPTFGGSVDFLGKVVAEVLAKTKTEEIKEAVIGGAMDEIKKFIEKEYGKIERKVDLVFGDKKVEVEGVVHSKFDTILKFVQADEPVFLTGPAGAGKNYLCQQVAKALGLDFYFSNAVTQEHKITGFTDAMGVYRESQFYKAFKFGGLFMLDEMDASIPEVLIILNAAIANRYFDFPAPIGYVAAHPDFRVVAAGNTFGNGADYDYVGRNQLDAASLDRFAMVRIDYDENIENGCGNGNTELVDFCRAFRKAANDAGIRTVVSYRAISRMAKLDASMKTHELLETCLLKSLDKDDLKILKDKLAQMVSTDGKYFKGLERAIRERRA